MEVVKSLEVVHRRDPEDTSGSMAAAFVPFGEDTLVIYKRPLARGTLSMDYQSE